MDGTLRLRITQPLEGWISKIHGLVTRLPDVKSESGRPGRKDGGGAIVGEDERKEREKEDKGETSEWSALERLDDDFEQWGGCEVFRKEERFFGSMQGSVYQVPLISSNGEMMSVVHSCHVILFREELSTSQKVQLIEFVSATPNTLYRQSVFSPCVTCPLLVPVLMTLTFPQPPRSSSAAASRHNSLQTRRTRLTGEE